MSAIAYYQWKYTGGGLCEMVLASGVDQLNGKAPNYVVDDDQPNKAICELRMAPKYGEKFPAAMEKKPFFCMFPDSAAGCCKNCWKINFPGLVSNTGKPGFGTSPRTFYVVNPNPFQGSCWKSSNRPQYTNSKPYPEGHAMAAYPTGITDLYSTTIPVQLTIFYSTWNHGFGSIPVADLAQGLYVYRKASNDGKAWSCNGGILDLSTTTNQGTSTGVFPSQITFEACDCSEGANLCGQTSLWNYVNGPPRWVQIVGCPGGCADGGPPGYTPASFGYTQEMNCS